MYSRVFETLEEFVSHVRVIQTTHSGIRALCGIMRGGSHAAFVQGKSLGIPVQHW
jgi:hypothetical protein